MDVCVCVWVCFCAHVYSICICTGFELRVGLGGFDQPN